MVTNKSDICVYVHWYCLYMCVLRAFDRLYLPLRTSTACVNSIFEWHHRFFFNPIVSVVSAQPRRQPASLRDRRLSIFIYYTYLIAFLTSLSECTIDEKNKFHGSWVLYTIFQQSCCFANIMFRELIILACVSSRFLSFSRRNSHSLAVWFPSRAVLETLATPRGFCDYC